ncbi:hypothetical protein RJ639_014614 [Escallonia herrerae]|uniref:Uncharacterized protein n=1 Tax=Escallonia herrerae TaxID=1293975 RepID=A0AA88VFS2_9ASTE|nr:hypothetical protein RJ639_014614 [Escallonia herrerae]
MASVLLYFLELQMLVRAEPQVPCYFIFGDSLVDNGNNNALTTLAKVNFPPYGIDFVNGPTGRFSNGRTTADILGELLGFDNFILPFATARGQDIQRGVNYASGAAGIRAETGQQVGDRISLDTQLLNHGITISRLLTLQRNLAFTKDYLSKCIYTVGMGYNDYLNNYYSPQYYPTSRLFTPDQYAVVLIQQYSKQLKILYNYGARKVAVFGIWQLGCTPAGLARYGTNGSACVKMINDAVQLFNNRLKPLVDYFNNNLYGAKFTYINITSITAGDPSAAGITFVNTPCCNISATTGLCIENQAPCSNRNKYVFWDTFHPTEIINLFVSGRAYRALSPSDAYPIDIRTLAQL